MAMKSSSSPRMKGLSVEQPGVEGPAINVPETEAASLSAVFESLAADVADLNRVRDLSALAAPGIAAFAAPGLDADDRTFVATCMLMAEQASLTSEKDGQRGIGLGNSLEAMSLRYACRGENLALLEGIASGQKLVFPEPKPAIGESPAVPGITAERQASLAMGALAQMGVIVRPNQIVEGAARFANSAISGDREPLAHTFVRRRRALQ